MNLQHFSKTIDHTLLKPDSTEIAVKKLVNEAIENNFASVCVLPHYVGLCNEMLNKSDVAVCTVVGFPLGAHLTEVKQAETRLALSQGAKEIDMVINIAAMKNGDYKLVKDEITALNNLCKEHSAILKVIVETCLLTEQEKIDICNIVSEAGAAFIKTSTGFSTAGATLHDIKLMREHCAPEVRIKASGGIKTLDFAMELIQAGASRIGTSAGLALVNELKNRKYDI